MKKTLLLMSALLFAFLVWASEQQIYPPEISNFVGSTEGGEGWENLAISFYRCSDGGSPITKFYIECRRPGARQYTMKACFDNSEERCVEEKQKNGRISKYTQYKIENMVNYLPTSIRVCAENSAGLGSYSFPKVFHFRDSHSKR